MKTRIRHVRRRRNERSGGFSLIEVMLVTSMMMTVITTIGVGLRSGHAGNLAIQRRAQLTDICSELMDRMFRMDFGQAADASATADQLSELFDSDDDLGSATLSSLRVAAGEAGLAAFTITEFPFGGTFEVRVDADLNGDSDEADEREGRADLLRINILHDGILILESMRCAPWKL